MLIRDPECAPNLSGLIGQLIAELRNNGDILSRLNALELLSDVAARYLPFLVTQG